MICTTPRSGSTLLCRMLEATGVAGRPDSHFHAASLEGWLDDYGLEPARFSSRAAAIRDVVAAAVARGRGDGKVFGLRMQRGSLDFFLAQLEWLVPGRMGGAQRIEAIFGPTLYIHLSRPDRLDQAISRLRAEQTGLWHRRADGSELERLAPPRPPRYDAARIAQLMAELDSQDADWARWFAAESICPLRISYNDLASSPQEVLAEVLAKLGLDAGLARSVAPPTAKLADGMNQDWRARFLAELPDEGN